MNFYCLNDWLKHKYFSKYNSQAIVKIIALQLESKLQFLIFTINASSLKLEKFHNGTFLVFITKFVTIVFEFKH